MTITFDLVFNCAFYDARHNELSAQGFVCKVRKSAIIFEGTFNLVIYDSMIVNTCSVSHLAVVC